MFRARTVVEEDAVQISIAEIRDRYSRVDHLFEAIKWRLARDPLSCAVAIPDTPFFVMKTETVLPTLTDIPVLRVLYKFDENEVHIKAIAVVEHPPGDI